MHESISTTWLRTKFSEMIFMITILRNISFNSIYKLKYSCNYKSSVINNFSL